jgi:hypothetical protein
MRIMTEDRRLVCLRFLSEVPGYRLNLIVLRDAVATQGHDVTREILAADAVWLESMGLLTIERQGDEVWLARLTPRGKSVATGSEKVPGVKAPEPGLDF